MYILLKISILILQFEKHNNTITCYLPMNEYNTYLFEIWMDIGYSRVMVLNFKTILLLHVS